MLGSLACARIRVACFACVRGSHAWMHTAGGRQRCSVNTCSPPACDGAPDPAPRVHLSAMIAKPSPTRMGLVPTSVACVAWALARVLRVRAWVDMPKEARLAPSRGDMRWFTSPRSGTSERYTTATEKLALGSTLCACDPTCKLCTDCAAAARLRLRGWCASHDCVACVACAARMRGGARLASSRSPRRMIAKQNPTRMGLVILRSLSRHAFLRGVLRVRAWVNIARGRHARPLAHPPPTTYSHA
jgi:hypothetical protein